MKNEVLAIPVVFVSLVVFTEVTKSISLEDYHPDESHNAVMIVLAHGACVLHSPLGAAVVIPGCSE